MTSAYKVVTEEGEFKVHLQVFKAPLKHLQCLLNTCHKTTVRWSLTVFLLVIFIPSLICILFSICWLLLSKKTTSHTCLTPLNSFTQALSFSIHMHTQMTYTQNTINSDCYLVMLMFLMQNITFIIYKSIFLVVVLKLVLYLFNTTVKFNKITIAKKLMFYEMTEDEESKKRISNSCRESTTTERRGSVMAYRKASILGRRASKAECHRFNRQKTTKSSRYEKLKTKKSAKETSKRSSEVFKMVVEVDGDDVVLLACHAFLLVKKKVKTALKEFMEVVATREIKFEKEENTSMKHDEMEDVTEANKLIHKVDDKSVMKEFMKFILKKKKWKMEEEKSDVGSENEMMTLWSDECMSMSKMELEVLIVLQYQHIQSTSLSEVRRSFSLADFKLHNPQNLH